MEAGHHNADHGMSKFYDREEYNDDMQMEVDKRVGEYTENNTIKWLEECVSRKTWDAIIEDLENYAEQEITEESANARAEYEYNEKYC